MAVGTGPSPVLQRPLPVEAKTVVLDPVSSDERFPSMSLPSDHTLIGTWIKVSKPLDTVVNRLQVFCRLNCCDTVRNENNLRASLPCGLEFSVALWEKDDAVLVELHRLQGCSVGQHYVRRSLFHVLQAENEPTKSDMIWAKPTSRNICESIKRSFKQDNQLDGPLDNSVVSRCHHLLKSSLVDQNQLGLENLLFVVSQCSNNAKRCLAGTDEVSECFRSRLAHSLKSSVDPSSQMCKTVLSIIIAALRSADVTVIDHYDADFWTVVDSVSREKLKNADQSPQEAALAAECMYLMESILPSSQVFNADDSLGVCAMRAYEVGKTCHVGLEKHCKVLIEHLMDKSSL